MSEPYIIGITGHRPARIKGQEGEIRRWLRGWFNHYKKIYDGNVVVISGMARGVDQIAADVAIELGLKLWCYFPYRHEFQGKEAEIAAAADLILYEVDEYDGARCYINRDRRIVDDCDVLFAVFDGEEVGGTWQTYKYAQGYKDVIMFNIGKENV